MKLARKIISRFIGNSPLAIRPFSNWLVELVGAPIDMAESYTKILYRENGGYTYFKPFENRFKAPFEYRKVNNKTRYKNGGLFPEAERIIYSLEDGNIFGSLGIVYDSTLRIAPNEAARDWIKKITDHPFFFALKISTPIYKKGIALSLATTGADGGFYHFLHEALPKLYLCSGLLDKTDYVLVAGDQTSWKTKWLNAAGVPIDKIIWLAPTAHYKFDQLIFTSRIIYDQQFTPWSIHALRELYQINNYNSVSNQRIIWSSRGNANHRVFAWEERIKHEFKNIEIVDFSTLSPEETMRICQECAVFIGPHGAGFSNLIFCKPRTKVLEIFPDQNYQPLYNRLSQVCGLTHEAIILDFEDSESNIGLKYFEAIYNSL